MIPNLIGIVILVAGFAVIIERARLVPYTRKVIELSRQSVQALGNPALSDDDKERIAQSNTLAMIRLLGALLCGTLAALGVPLLVVWGLDRLGWLSLDDVLTSLARWDVLVAVSVVGVGVYWITSKWRTRVS